MTKDVSKLDSYEIYTLVLFALYKMTKVPEYSVLSELLFTMDRKTLLRFCAIFGGETIKVPTLEDLSILLIALQLYQKIQVEKMSLSEAINSCSISKSNMKKVLNTYETIVKLFDKGELSIE